MKSVAYFLTAVFFVCSMSVVEAQDDGIGIIQSLDDTSSFVSGQIDSNQADDVWIEYEDESGVVGTSYGFVTDEGDVLGFVDQDASFGTGASLLAATLYSTTSGVSVGSMLLIVADPPNDGSDFGPGWTPYDIHNPYYWNNCLNVANNIKDELEGGQVVWVVPEDPAPFLPPYMGVTTGWHFHYVVIKDGKVYDGFTVYEGLPLDDWKDRFHPDQDGVVLVYPDDDDYPNDPQNN